VKELWCGEKGLGALLSSVPQNKSSHAGQRTFSTSVGVGRLSFVGVVKQSVAKCFNC
jgi:hypothetical protein